MKQDICICVGGPEGARKTLPFLIIGKIIEIFILLIVGMQEEIHCWKFDLEEQKVFKSYKEFGGDLKTVVTFRLKFKDICSKVEIKKSTVNCAIVNSTKITFVLILNLPKKKRKLLIHFLLI